MRFDDPLDTVEPDGRLNQRAGCLMTDQDKDDDERRQMSLPLRAGLAVLAALIAGLFAHQAISDPISTTIAVIFVGVGVFLTIGRSGDGVDGGGGGDGGGG